MVSGKCQSLFRAVKLRAVRVTETDHDFEVRHRIVSETDDRTQEHVHSFSFDGFSNLGNAAVSNFGSCGFRNAGLG